jgi:hypothetical protein
MPLIGRHQQGGRMTPEASRILAGLVEDALAAGIDLDRRAVVYLLHFDRPLCHARHYLGTTRRRLGQRLVEHIGGHRTGSKLVAAVVARGIGVRIARLWRGGHGLELRLKRRKKSRQLCPICRAVMPAHSPAATRAGPDAGCRSTRGPAGGPIARPRPSP